MFWLPFTYIKWKYFRLWLYKDKNLHPDVLYNEEFNYRMFTLKYYFFHRNKIQWNKNKRQISKYAEQFKIQKKGYNKHHSKILFSL